MFHPLPRVIAAAFAMASLPAQTSTYVPTPAAPGATSLWVWDSARNRVVAVDGPTGGLWDWDGSRWEPRSGAPNDPTFSKVVYDPHRRVVIAGSREWDGARWLGNGSTWPPATSWFGVVAFDVARRRLIAPASGSVFEWDGASWNPIPAPNGPTARVGPAFAYDPVHARCVLYGGGDNSGALGDCWSWNGAAWTLLANAAPPGPRSGASLAFEPTGSQLMLYGGFGNTSTWRLVGTTFSPIATTSDPGERNQAQFVFDGQGLLLGGGSVWRGGELWRLQNNDWSELPGGSPMPRYYAGFAWDPLRSQAVVFGGARSQSQQQGMFDDTWTFDGQWHRYSGTGPGLWWIPQLAWSAVDGAVMLHGTDTWLWNGTNWTRRQTAVAPPWRWAGALVPDPTGGVLLFGGQDLALTIRGDQWRWDGANWLQLTPAVAPSARVALAAHDPLRNVVVMAGGYGATQPLQDTWEWNGTSWTPFGNGPFVVGSPNDRIAFNPATGRIRTEGFGQYEWDGSTWTTITTATPSGHGASYAADLARGRLLRCSFADRGIAALTPTPASSERYGNGCAIGSAPALTTIGRPTPGALQFALAAMTHAPGAATLLAIGLQAQNQPLGSGCSSLVGAVLGVHFLVAAPGGQATLALPIPNALALRGVSFTAQVAVVDAARSLYSGLTLSDGFRVTIGD